MARFPTITLVRMTCGRKRRELMLWLLASIFVTRCHLCSARVIPNTGRYRSHVDSIDAVSDEGPSSLSNCLSGVGTSVHFKGYFATVDCRHRRLTYVTDDLPETTEVLLLQDNAISVIQSTSEIGPSYSMIGRMHRLMELDLSLNRIHRFPDLSSLNESMNLRVIDLSFNRIEQLSDCHVAESIRRTLEILLLERNLIRQMEMGCLERLEHLRWLSLAGNRLRRIHWKNFHQLPRLSILNVDSNEIEEVSDDAFLGLRSLEVLRLSGNRIARLSDGAFRGLDSLQRLDLSGNLLQVVPAQSFRYFEALQLLALDSNPIGRLSRRGLHSFGVHELTLVNLTSLRVVEEEAISNLTSLKVLRIENSPQLCHIHERAIVDSPEVTTLHLHGNALRTFPRELVESLRELELLRLTGNPLRVECEAEWIRDHIRRNNTMPQIDIDATHNTGDFSRQTTDQPQSSPTHPVSSTSINPPLASSSSLSSSFPSSFSSSSSASASSYQVSSFALPSFSTSSSYTSSMSTPSPFQSSSSLPPLSYSSSSYSSNQFPSNSSFSFLQHFSNSSIDPSTIAPPSYTFSSSTSSSSSSSYSSSFFHSNSFSSSTSDISFPTLSSSLPTPSSSTHSSISMLSSSLPSHPSASSFLHPSQSTRITGSSCPPEILPTFDPHLYVSLGGTVTLTCLAMATPRPSIHWVSPTGRVLNRSVKLDGLKHTNTNTRTLVIDDVRPRDTGEYRCLAGNGDGRSQTTLTLHAYDALARLTCQSIGPDHVTVTWNDIESTASSVSYVITHRLLTTSGREEVKGHVALRSRMRSWRLGDLSRSSQYELCLGFLRTGIADPVQINCTEVTTDDVIGVVTWTDELGDLFVVCATAFTCLSTLALTVVMVTACRRWARIRRHSVTAIKEEEEDAEEERENGEMGGHLANEADTRGGLTEQSSLVARGILSLESLGPQLELDEDRGGSQGAPRSISTLQLISTPPSSSSSSAFSLSSSNSIFPSSLVSSTSSSSFHSPFSNVV